MRIVSIAAIAAIATAVSATAAPLPKAFGVVKYSNLLYNAATDDYDVEQENDLVYGTTVLTNAGSAFPTSVLSVADFSKGGSTGAIVGVDGPVSASASSSLTYWLRVNSATNRQVFLFARAKGEASFLSEDAGFASGQFQIGDFINGFGAMFADRLAPSDSFSKNLLLVAQTNTLYKVTLDTTARLGGVVPGAGIPPAQGFALAFIDPQFRAVGDDVTLEFSEGITGASFVPEPGTWAMMIVGFGMVGSVLRRRVRAVA